MNMVTEQIGGAAMFQSGVQASEDAAKNKAARDAYVVDAFKLIYQVDAMMAAERAKALDAMQQHMITAKTQLQMKQMEESGAMEREVYKQTQETKRTGMTIEGENQRKTMEEENKRWLERYKQNAEDRRKQAELEQLYWKGELEARVSTDNNIRNNKTAWNTAVLQARSNAVVARIKAGESFAGHMLGQGYTAQQASVGGAAYEKGQYDVIGNMGANPEQTRKNLETNSVIARNQAEGTKAQVEAQALHDKNIREQAQFNYTHYNNVSAILAGYQESMGLRPPSVTTGTGEAKEKNVHSAVPQAPYDLRDANGNPLKPGSKEYETAKTAQDSYEKQIHSEIMQWGSLIAREPDPTMKQAYTKRAIEEITRKIVGTPGGQKSRFSIEHWSHILSLSAEQTHALGNVTDASYALFAGLPNQVQVDYAQAHMANAQRQSEADQAKKGQRPTGDDNSTGYWSNHSWAAWIPGFSFFNQQGAKAMRNLGGGMDALYANSAGREQAFMLARQQIPNKQSNDKDALAYFRTLSPSEQYEALRLAGKKIEEATGKKDNVANVQVKLYDEARGSVSDMLIGRHTEQQYGSTNGNWFGEGGFFDRSSSLGGEITGLLVGAGVLKYGGKAVKAVGQKVLPEAAQTAISSGKQWVVDTATRYSRNIGLTEADHALGMAVGKRAPSVDKGVADNAMQFNWLAPSEGTSKAAQIANFFGRPVLNTTIYKMAPDGAFTVEGPGWLSNIMFGEGRAIIKPRLPGAVRTPGAWSPEGKGPVPGDTWVRGDALPGARPQIFPRGHDATFNPATAYAEGETRLTVGKGVTSDLGIEPTISGSMPAPPTISTATAEELAAQPKGVFRGVVDKAKKGAERVKGAFAKKPEDAPAFGTFTRQEVTGVQGPAADAVFQGGVPVRGQTLGGTPTVRTGASGNWRADREAFYGGAEKNPFYNDPAQQMFYGNDRFSPFEVGRVVVSGPTKLFPHSEAEFHAVYRQAFASVAQKDPAVLQEAAETVMRAPSSPAAAAAAVPVAEHPNAAAVLNLTPEGEKRLVDQARQVITQSKVPVSPAEAQNINAAAPTAPPVKPQAPTGKPVLVNGVEVPSSYARTNMRPLDASVQPANALQKQVKTPQIGYDPKTGNLRTAGTSLEELQATKDRLVQSATGVKTELDAAQAALAAAQKAPKPSAKTISEAKAKVDQLQKSYDSLNTSIAGVDSDISARASIQTGASAYPRGVSTTNAITTTPGLPRSDAFNEGLNVLPVDGSTPSIMGAVAPKPASFNPMSSSLNPEMASLPTDSITSEAVTAGGQKVLGAQAVPVVKSPGAVPTGRVLNPAVPTPVEGDLTTGGGRILGPGEVFYDNPRVAAPLEAGYPLPAISTTGTNSGISEAEALAYRATAGNVSESPFIRQPAAPTPEVSTQYVNNATVADAFESPFANVASGRPIEIPQATPALDIAPSAIPGARQSYAASRPSERDLLFQARGQMPPAAPAVPRIEGAPAPPSEQTLIQNVRDGVPNTEPLAPGSRSSWHSPLWENPRNGQLFQGPSVNAAGAELPPGMSIGTQGRGIFPGGAYGPTSGVNVAGQVPRINVASVNNMPGFVRQGPRVDVPTGNPVPLPSRTRAAIESSLDSPANAPATGAYNPDLSPIPGPPVRQHTTPQLSANPPAIPDAANASALANLKQAPGIVSLPTVDTSAGAIGISEIRTALQRKGVPLEEQQNIISAYSKNLEGELPMNRAQSQAVLDAVMKEPENLGSGLQPITIKNLNLSNMPPPRDPVARQMLPQWLRSVVPEAKPVPSASSMSEALLKEPVVEVTGRPQRIKKGKSRNRR